MAVFADSIAVQNNSPLSNTFEGAILFACTLLAESYHISPPRNIKGISALKAYEAYNSTLNSQLSILNSL